ncbi:MAG TPA: MMPL family transporter [Candidatus Binatia bacterium]|nr:MMPL family transporter [Candidatus Binatia bacterium]
MSLRILFAWVWAIVVCLLFIHSFYLWFGKGIAPDTDILALLPVQERDPVLQQALTRMLDSSQQRLIVLVGAEDWSNAQHAADGYGDVLARHPDLFQSADPMSDRRDWLALFRPHRLNLLTPQAEADLRSRPEEYWTDIALAKLYSPFSGLQLGAWRDDPFGLFGRWIQARAQETPVRSRDGRLFVENEGRQYVVLPFTLRRPAFSMETQQRVMPALAQARQVAQSSGPQVEVVVTGVILHAAAASEQARKEISLIGVGSVIGVVALTWITFHQFYPVALILLSIGIGCLGALSVCWWIFDRLHILTLVFGASLVGVAQDYGIYFLCNRFNADKKIGSMRLLRRLLPGLALTLTTTVIGYFGLIFAPFPGLRQMGIFSALGLLFAWLTVVLWFPILVHSSSAQATSPARRYGASVARWPVWSAKPSMVWAGVLFGAVAAFGFSRLGVDDDIRLLQNPPKNLIDDQLKLSQLLDTPSLAQFYLARGATPDAVLQREEMLKERLDTLIEEGAISGYQATSNWVPSRGVQTMHRRLVEQTLLNENGPLSAVALKIGENGGWVAAMRQHLLNSSSTLTPDELLNTPASEPWRHLWLGQVSGGYASMITVRGVTQTGLVPLQQAGAGLEGVRWVDQIDEISSVLGRYRRYMGWVMLVSFFTVYCLLFPRYRGATWRVLAPTVLASVTTIALLGMTGESLQLFHVLALMLILGIGVDYGIFFQENPIQRPDTEWLAAGLSALSTLLSFGLLGLSKTPALQAFGVTLSIGIITVWLIVPCFRRERAWGESL